MQINDTFSGRPRATRQKGITNGFGKRHTFLLGERGNRWRGDHRQSCLEQEAGISLSLITSLPRRPAKCLLQRYDLERFFVHIDTFASRPYRKPSPKLLSLASLVRTPPISATAKGICVWRRLPDRPLGPWAGGPSLKLHCAEQEPTGFGRPWNICFGSLADVATFRWPHLRKRCVFRGREPLSRTSRQSPVAAETICQKLYSQRDGVKPISETMTLMFQRPSVGSRTSLRPRTTNLTKQICPVSTRAHQTTRSPGNRPPGLHSGSSVLCA